MAQASSTLELIAALGDPATRLDAGREVAQRLGAQELLLFVADPELGALVPARGFMQTLRGGGAWRSFLAGCAVSARSQGLVDLPAGRMRPATAMSHAGLVAVLLGGEPIDSEMAVLCSTMPLLAAMLQAEQAVALAGAEAAEAREAASRGGALTAALEAGRAEQAQLNAALRHEHQRKDEFLAMLAHELRNPLSPLLTSLEILRHPGASAEIRARQIDVMRRQATQLSRLVEDLMDVSRVGRGRIQLKRERVSLRQLIDHALEECQPQLQARRHQLSVALPTDALMVDVDPARMAQVFANLLNNAAKYTDPGGRLELTAQRSSHEVAVRIEDDGMGIAADVLPHVFDLFAQGPVSMERAQGGLGIGLTLVRTLLELHGGSVTAYSAGPGRGSTFTVRLPLAEPGPSAAPAPAQRSRAPEQRPLRVLVVDDNHDVADSMAQMLALMGHHAETAYDGIKALQLASDLDPDLVLLDLGLPDMDGFEVARRLKRLAHFAARLVALTGYGMAEDKRRAQEAGFDEHVVKPVTPETIADIASRTVRRPEPARPGAADRGGRP